LARTHGIHKLLKCTVAAEYKHAPILARSTSPSLLGQIFGTCGHAEIHAPSVFRRKGLDKGYRVIGSSSSSDGIYEEQIRTIERLRWGRKHWLVMLTDKG
jgi:hypothetical protein